MKKLFCLFAPGLISLQLLAQSGEEHFKTVCAACHTVGKGLLVGPDLKGSHKKHPEKWLIKWIRSSQTMVNEGDKKAVELFNQYNQIPMPDNPQFSDADIKAIIAYIKTESGDVVEKDQAGTSVSPEKPSGKSIENEAAGNKPEEKSAAVTAPAPAAPAEKPINESTAGIVSQAAAAPVEINKSGNTFLYLGIGLMILFFLSALAVLAKSVLTLSKELANTAKNNK